MNADYRRIEQAIRYIRDHAESQPSLDDVAATIGLSPFHFQRLFQRWAGVSPKRFLQYVTVENAKRLLRDASTVLETTWETGLSSPSRLHDLFVTTEAVTPGEYKRQGDGLEIRYGFHDSPFGECLIATTGRGVCALTFVDERREAEERLLHDWSAADCRHDPAATMAAATAALAALSGEPDAPLALLLRGTNFQVRVWEALLRIPPGRVVSYADVASAIGQPGAGQAVGSAVAANRIAGLIPCHRVLRSTGAFGEYRWGADRKVAMLGWEAARVETAADATTRGEIAAHG